MISDISDLQMVSVSPAPWEDTRHRLETGVFALYVIMEEVLKQLQQHHFLNVQVSLTQLLNDQ